MRCAPNARHSDQFTAPLEEKFLERRYPLCTRREAARTAAPTSRSGQINGDTDPSTATVGYATPDRHKTAATIATDASTRITIRMEWYWSHLLRSLFQSPGSALKSQAATRLLIGTRQISENGTVAASKTADDKHAHQDQLPLARVSNETTTKSSAAAYQNGMTLPNSRASGLAASACAASWSFESTGWTKTPIANSLPVRSTVTSTAIRSIA